MLTGILIIAVVGLLAVLSHRRTRLEEKIYKNVPLSDWLVILVFPVCFYLGWVMVVKNIIERPYVTAIPFDDFDILAITILFMVYGFVGNAFHFTAKILWRFLKKQKNSMAYKINEMFHGRFTHYLIYLNGFFIVFFLAILELNHPLSDGVSSSYLTLTSIAGLVSGLSARKAIFYTHEWFGGYHKPLFFLISILLLTIVWLQKTVQVRYSVYPVNLFIVFLGGSFVASFILRQLFIFTKLDHRRRLRFLAKILSV